MPLIIRRFAVFSLALGAVLYVAAQDTAGETYPVRIIIEPRPDAKFYQIEWLESNEIEGQAEAPAETSEKQKIVKTDIRRNLPVRFKYFRLRSAYRENLFGPWGEIVEIQRPIKAANNANKPEGNPETDPATGNNPEGGNKPATNNNPEGGNKPATNNKPEGGNKPASNGVKSGPGAKPIVPQDVFAQVIDKDGKIKWVLRGTSVPAERLDGNTPLFYDVLCLTDTNAPENTNGRKKYEGPIPFTRAGQYKMNLYGGEDPAQSEPLQTWIFWVYTQVPRSYVKFYAPFLHGKGGFTVGGKTKIALKTHPSPVAVDKMEYRIYPDTSTTLSAGAGQPGAWIKYEDEIEVNSFAKDQYGFFNIEYQATNVAGATEPPQTRRILIDAKGPVIEEVPAETAGGEVQLSFKDENFPVVVRVYQGATMVEDKYFKFWRAHEVMKMPAAGSVIHAIDLLGNETILKK